MKISNHPPPNYELILTTFPIAVLKKSKPIFAYGNIIYNPFNVNITKDVEIHEEVHEKQQGGNPDSWWAKYLMDKEFRLSQEIEAYGTQLAFIQKLIDSPSLANWKKEKMAEALSGELYGNLLSYGEAESKIRNYAKHLK